MLSEFVLKKKNVGNVPLRSYLTLCLFLKHMLNLHVKSLLTFACGKLLWC